MKKIFEKIHGMNNDENRKRKCMKAVDLHIPLTEYISCTNAMLLLGFDDYGEFCDFACAYMSEIIQLPCTTRGLLIFDEEEDWYHRDMITLLQSRLDELSQ